MYRANIRKLHHLPVNDTSYHVFRHVYPLSFPNATEVATLRQISRNENAVGDAVRLAELDEKPWLLGRKQVRHEIAFRGNKLYQVLLIHLKNMFIVAKLDHVSHRLHPIFFSPEVFISASPKNFHTHWIYGTTD